MLVTLNGKLYLLYSCYTPGDSESSNGNRTQSSRLFTSNIYKVIKKSLCT
jgi:hypothetical protein